MVQDTQIQYKLIHTSNYKNIYIRTILQENNIKVKMTFYKIQNENHTTL